MGYREIPEDRVLEFPATSGFKGWEPFFTSDSTTHPAKINLNLLKWILETYTEPGEVVLDPMAGTGSTIILASILGRHGVAVEYESRFCDMIRANIELTERQTTLVPKGRMICIQGDARELSKLLGELDSIVTSPPYSDIRKKSKISEEDLEKKLAILEKGAKEGRYHSGGTDYHTPGRLKWIRGWMGETNLSEGNIGNLKHGDIDAIVTSPPYSSQWGVADENRPEATFEREKRHRERHPELKGKRPPLPGAYSTSMNNIGNLPHGDINAIVTSPPFGPSQTGGGIFKEGYKAPGEEEVSDPDLPQRHARPLSNDPQNIDNLPYGESVDAVITSPPYEGVALQDYGSSNEALLDFEREVRKSFKTKGYYEHDGKRYTEREWRKVNKGELKPRGMPELWKKILEQRKGSSYSEIAKVDAVVTSPPYEGILSEPEDRKHSIDQSKWADGRKIAPPHSQVHLTYPDSSDNIGNLKSDTYLQAMLQVYSECHKVLKDEGIMIVVTKNFIRDKKVIRLDLDTVKLCEAAGFTLMDRWYFKLPTRSFWRALYHKKHPEVPEVEFEDVLVFKKGLTFRG